MKTAYVIGYRDGKCFESSARSLTLALDSGIAPGVCKPFLKEMQDRLDNPPKELDVTADQLRDGIDNFYVDYKNRLISVPDAIPVVMGAIGSASDDIIKSLIDTLRKSAARP